MKFKKIKCDRESRFPFDLTEWFMAPVSTDDAFFEGEFLLRYGVLADTPLLHLQTPQEVGAIGQKIVTSPLTFSIASLHLKY